MVHNGIIENFTELRMELENRGHSFSSKTDTEVIPHLIEEAYKKNPELTLEDAVVEAVKRIEGSYAVAVISTKEPDKIVCARNESPLVLGVNGNAVYCASDLTAFLPLTNQAVFVNDGELVTLTPDGYTIKRIQDRSPVTRDQKLIDWT